jgi:peptide-methionine (S)-S-oxide reductase
VWIKRIKRSLLLFAALPFAACGQSSSPISHTKAFDEMMQTKKDRMMNNDKMNSKSDTATFAAGCFWCVEAQFKELKGVKKVISGFTGGTVPHPTYEEVCTGTTGHAEACNIIYDPSVISYDELLAAFFVAHDPTQLNRQGNDVGTQYRSAIFYHNAEQKKLAGYYINKLNEEKAYPNPVVTQVQPYTVFYKAENYHQNYYAKNGNVPYCRLVIKPKLDKFDKIFKDKIKTSE